MCVVERVLVGEFLDIWLECAKTLLSFISALESQASESRSARSVQAALE